MRFQEPLRVAVETVDLVDDDHVKLPALRIGEEAAEGGPPVVGARVALVDVLVRDDPALVLGKLAIGDRLLLDRVALLLFLDRDAQVQCGTEDGAFGLAVADHGLCSFSHAVHVTPPDLRIGVSHRHFAVLPV